MGPGSRSHVIWRVDVKLHRTVFTWEILKAELDNHQQEVERKENTAEVKALFEESKLENREAILRILQT